MTREEITKEAISLVHKHKNTLLLFATGCGKTKASLECMKSIGGKWLVVLSETAAIKNWHDDIIKHNLQDLLMDIEFVLYASLHKHIGLSYEGITCDEAHHVSELKSDILSNINHRKFIGLSATLDSEVLQRIELAIGKCHRFNIPLKTAVKWGILPKPKIHIIPLELDNTSKSEEVILTKGVKAKRITIMCSYEDRWKHLKANEHVEIVCSCTQREKYNYYCEQVEYYKKQYFAIRNKALENKWLLSATNRKRFIAECKTEYVKKIIDSIKGRYICFAGSIKQCNEIGGNNIVHSKVKDPQLVIDRFNNHQIDNLFAVGMLKEVVNLSEANVIIVQLDSGTRATIQMVG